MKNEWSLDVLYKGYQDTAFQNDVNHLNELITSIKDYVGLLDQVKPAEALLELIRYLEEYKILFGRLYAYLSLRQSTNTTDSETVALLGKLEELNSTLSKENAMIHKYIGKIPNLDQIISENEKLKNYDFLLHEIIQEAKHTLSDEVEEAIAKMNLSAGSAWSMMHQYLTSTVVVDYKGEEITLSSIRNQAVLYQKKMQ